MERLESMHKDVWLSDKITEAQENALCKRDNVTLKPVSVTASALTIGAHVIPARQLNASTKYIAHNVVNRPVKRIMLSDITERVVQGRSKHWAIGLFNESDDIFEAIIKDSLGFRVLHIRRRDNRSFTMVCVITEVISNGLDSESNLQYKVRFDNAVGRYAPKWE